MKNAAAAVALVAVLSLLAGCACEGGGAIAPAGDPGGMSAAKPREAGRRIVEPVAAAQTDPSGPDREEPPAVGPLGGGGSGSEAPLGLFAPVLPTLGMDTHTTECDPFDDPYQVCL